MSGIEKTIGHYRILNRIAAGGMGIVYRAEDLILHRLVALKFLSPDTSADEEYRARFLREARVAAGLNHQNTCTVYEVGEFGSAADLTEDPDSIGSPGTLFIAMEFIEGETLAAWLARTGRLSVRETLDVASQVAEGLAEAHTRRIVHRDLKPQNVMVARGGLVKIVDFGLAKPLRPVRSPGALMSTSDMISAELDDGAVIGTCAYMSPEQASRQTVDPRSDVFSFGIMLYEMLTGRLPFRGETPTVVLAKILEAEPDPLPSAANGEVPAQLARMVRKCLQKLPQDRYADARELVAELTSVRQHLPRGAAISSPLVLGWLTSMRIGPRLPARQSWLAVVAILLVIVGGLTYGVRRILNTRQVVTATIDSSSIRVDSPVATVPSDAVAGVNRPDAVNVSQQNPRSQATAPTVPPENSRAGAQVTGAEPPRPIVAASAPTAAGPLEPRPPTPGTGTLTLDSSPRASVTLGGKLIGITPLTIETGPGVHALVMSSPEGGRWRGRVEVVAGESSLIRRELNAMGRLTITSDVWAEVSLDGGPPEQTPVDFSQIAAGLHDLRASREGYVTQTQEILIEEGSTSYVRLTLEKQQ